MTLNICTSYYSNLKRIPEYMVPVSISLSTPKGLDILRYSKLYPSPGLLSWYKTAANPSWDEYTKRYNKETLSKLNKYQVLTELIKETGSYNIVLLCWEGADKHCHRHNVADWLPINVYEFK